MIAWWSFMDYQVVVDLNYNWGESEFTLTLKKGKQTATTPSCHGGVEPRNMEQPTAIITEPLAVDSQADPMTDFPIVLPGSVRLVRDR